MLIPRSKLDFAASRNELGNVGIYFLVGGADEDAKQTVYIGEAEDCLVRLKQHNKSKDFWSVAIVVISKTQYFTKTHIKFLEWYSHDLAIKVGRYKIENPTVPTRPYVSESMQADLIDNFDTVRTLVATLGYPIFDEITKPERADVLVCKGKEALAEGEYSEDGLIVFAGSTCNLEETKTAGPWVTGMRSKLLEQGIIVKDGSIYRFSTDHIFASPSAAAATVLGRRANGWIEWKYKDGRTLDEVKRQV
jgi:hypothetical protein